MWVHETLAQLHELLQSLLHTAGARAEENPFPPPKRYERPGSFFDEPEEQESEDDGDAAELNALPDSYFEEA